MVRHGILLLLASTVVASLTIGACGGRTEQGPRSVDSSGPATPQDTTPIERPAAPTTLSDSVVQDYSRVALAVPRSEMDSLLRSAQGSDPRKLQDLVQARMNRQDTVARRELARKYRISIDSVNAILAFRAGR